MVEVALHIRLSSKCGLKIKVILGMLDGGENLNGCLPTLGILIA